MKLRTFAHVDRTTDRTTDRAHHRVAHETVARKWSAWILIIVALLLAGCGSGTPKSDEIASKMESNLAKVKTLKGRLRLTMGTVSLLQEVWVQPPKFLRAETEEGPPGFQGTILVLNEKEGWLYSPDLDIATVVDRSDYTPEMGGGAGSSFLETMPQEVLTVLKSAKGINVIGKEEVADRKAYHVEVVSDQETNIFKPGTLNIWLDTRFYYPLAVKTSTGLEIRFELIKFNEEIDPLTFVFFPPPGAAVRRVTKEGQ